jgi:hypothetical protein
MHVLFSWERQKEGDHYEDLDLGGKITALGGGGIDWINLAQGGGQWKAIVNAVKKIWAPKNCWKFLSSCITGSV